VNLAAASASAACLLTLFFRRPRTKSPTTNCYDDQLRGKFGFTDICPRPQTAPVAPERISKWRRKFFLVVPLHFLALKVQLVVLVSAFMIASTVRSVACFLFFYSRCPSHGQPFVKVGHVPPPCPMESAPLDRTILHRRTPTQTHPSNSLSNGVRVKLNRQQQ